MTGSYATTGEVGGTAFVTGAKTQDYSLATYGAKNNLAPLGLTGQHLKQDIFGVKVRVAGDEVLESDMLMPQIAVGLQSCCLTKPKRQTGAYLSAQFAF